jgi:hypothetical protein
MARTHDLDPGSDRSRLPWAGWVLVAVAIVAALVLLMRLV